MIIFNKFKYISIILLISLIFITGFIVGNWMTSMNIETFLSTSEKIRLDSLSLTLQTDIIKDNICDLDVFKLTKDRASLGKKLNELEKSLGKNNPKIIDIKKEYSIISIRQWLLVKSMKENCDTENNIIIFFYSNKEEKLQESELQGYVLDYLYRKYPEKISIYSMDIDLEEPTIKTLMGLYNVTDSPTLIINKEKFVGLKNRDELEHFIDL